SGANLQTLECGWQVYPAMYGDAKPHLFIYWTADDYNTTGCYNLTCNAFVQTGTAYAPGMALSPTSVSSGAQYVIELAYGTPEAAGGFTSMGHREPTQSDTTRTRNTRVVRLRRTPPRSITAAKWWAPPVFRPWVAARLPTPGGRRLPISEPSATGLPRAGPWLMPV